MTKLGPKRAVHAPAQDKAVSFSMKIVQLPYPPSANHLRIPVRGRLISSKEYRDWQEQAVWLIKRAMTPVEQYPITVWITLHTRNSRRDIDNAVKPTLDALVKAGILKDDNLACVNRLFVTYQPGKTECVYVSIEAT